MMLVQNSKIKKTAKANGVAVYNFGIPAFRSKEGIITCPNAGKCAAGCYAQCGTYSFPKVKDAYERRLEVTRSFDFLHVMRQEIIEKREKAIKKGQKLFIRVHDSGDFYTKKYQTNWYCLATIFPDVTFYAYTKQIMQSRTLVRPSNFIIIFSYGGKEDFLITPRDRHSKVFKNKNELVKAGYTDCSQDDLLALLTKKVGLVYHGKRAFDKTRW